MQKEFVEYELALRMKALGFDEPCVIIYYNDGKNYVISETLMTNNELSTHDEITSPLWQQAFRWFREKHGLGHMINGIGYESFIMNIGGVLHILNALEFKTYEEAELACLNKLIKIVESKKA